MGWLTGWQYRKSHVINPATGAGTGYQVGIKVYYGTGTDGTETVDNDSFGKVYLNGKCRTDFGDVRFCYSPDTEVLTEKGFLSIKEIVEKQLKVKIASLNPQTNKLVYLHPSRFFKIRYEGKMFHQKGRHIDLLVTPEHRMFVRKAWDKRKERKFIFIEARNLPRYVEYKRDADWDGIEQEKFSLPIIERKSKMGNPIILKNIQSIQMDDWLRFFGVWLAEGSAFIDEEKYKVHISQHSEKKRKAILEWCKSCGFEAKERPDGILIWSKQLYSYLKYFGHAENKFIPFELKQLCKRQLKILFDSLMFGDGNQRSKKSWTYATISKQLADDVQEIALKLGLVTTIKKRKEGTIAFGKYRRNGCYILSISDGHKTPDVGGKNDREWIEYDGYVYDIELPLYHLLYVRRDGKACWSSNCDDDGTTLLDCWMEEMVSSSYALFWVKVVDSLESSTQTIYCYTPDTEIMTEKGWVNLKDFIENKVNLKVATLNPETNKVEYHYPQASIKLFHHGKIVSFKGKFFDIKVTPEHRMWYKTRWDDKWRFGIASEIPSVAKFKRDFPYEGQEQEYFTLSEYSKEWTAGSPKHKMSFSKPLKKVPMDDWLRFFGIYIAEGSLRGTNTVVISQQNVENVKIIKGWIEALGYKASFTGTEFLINDIQLHHYLKQFGHAQDKWIPFELKTLSRRQLKILLDALMLGDGYKEEYYGTSSKQLADDFQEIALKVGYTASITQTNQGLYTIYLGHTADAQIRTKTFEDYDGFVYCLIVPNHLLYVRRNGKALWSGNCYYGKSDATYPYLASDLAHGEATFLLFDNFEDASFDTSKWSNQSATVTESGGKLRVDTTTTYSGVRSVNAIDLSTGKAMKARVAFEVPIGADGQQNAIGFCNVTGATTWWLQKYIWSPRAYEGTAQAYMRWEFWHGYDSSYEISLSGNGLLDGNYHKATLKAVQGSPAVCWMDEFGPWSTPHNVSTTTWYLWISKGYNYANGYTDIDWVFIRKWVTPEPAHGSWGSEELSTSKTFAFSHSILVIVVLLSKVMWSIRVLASKIINLDYYIKSIIRKLSSLSFKVTVNSIKGLIWKYHGYQFSIKQEVVAWKLRNAVERVVQFLYNIKSSVSKRVSLFFLSKSITNRVLTFLSSIKETVSRISNIMHSLRMLSASLFDFVYNIKQLIFKKSSAFWNSFNNTYKQLSILYQIFVYLLVSRLVSFSSNLRTFISKEVNSLHNILKNVYKFLPSFWNNLNILLKTALVKHNLKSSVNVVLAIMHRLNVTLTLTINFVSSTFNNILKHVSFQYKRLTLAFKSLLFTYSIRNLVTKLSVVLYSIILRIVLSVLLVTVYSLKALIIKTLAMIHSLEMLVAKLVHMKFYTKNLVYKVTVLSYSSFVRIVKLLSFLFIIGIFILKEVYELLLKSRKLTISLKATGIVLKLRNTLEPISFRSSEVKLKLKKTVEYIESKIKRD